MSTLAPTRKVTVGVASGAAATVFIYLVGQLSGTEPPAEIGAAFATLLAFAMSYATPEQEAAPLFTSKQLRKLKHLLDAAPD